MNQKLYVYLAQRNGNTGLVNISSVVVNSSNALFPQTVKLNQKPTQLLVNAEGTGTALVTISWTHNTKHVFDDAFSISVDKKQTDESFITQIWIRSAKK